MYELDRDPGSQAREAGEPWKNGKPYLIVVINIARATKLLRVLRRC
jgi:hypothetical protein